MVFEEIPGCTAALTFNFCVTCGYRTFPWAEEGMLLSGSESNALFLRVEAGAVDPLAATLEATGLELEERKDSGCSAGEEEGMLVENMASEAGEFGEAEP